MNHQVEPQINLDITIYFLQETGKLNEKFFQIIYYKLGRKKYIFSPLTTVYHFSWMFDFFWLSWKTPDLIQLWNIINEDLTRES